MSGTTAADFVSVTTSTRRKRHYAWADWAVYSLCGYRVHDQAYVDSLISWTGRSLSIADLPPCKQCERSRQRRIDGRPS